MRKSISGAIFGLIGSIFMLIISTLFILGTGISIDIIYAIDGSKNILPLALSWGAFTGSSIAIIGSSLCFRKARSGGVLNLVASCLTLSFSLYFLITLLTASITSAISLTLIFSIFMLIPSLLIIISSILGLCAKQQ